MRPFTTVRGLACVLARDNVDTDQIVPARFLRKPRDLSQGGYAPYLFHDLRAGDPAFPVTPGCVVLLAGANFGCGSSREGAVYALVDAGVRCVVAPGFGDIFAGNAARNGLLTVVMDDAPMTGGPIEVDLAAQEIVFPGDVRRAFVIEPGRRDSLLRGLDEIGRTELHRDAISRFEDADRALRPWSRPRSHPLG